NWLEDIEQDRVRARVRGRSRDGIGTSERLSGGPRYRCTATHAYPDTARWDRNRDRDLPRWPKRDDQARRDGDHDLDGSGYPLRLIGAGDFACASRLSRGWADRTRVWQALRERGRLGRAGLEGLELHRSDGIPLRHRHARGDNHDSERARDHVRARYRRPFDRVHLARRGDGLL